MSPRALTYGSPVTLAAGRRTAPGALPVRRWNAPPRLDIAIAAAFLVLTLAETVFNDSIESPLLHVLVGGGAMAAVAWRRVFPVQVAVAAVLANIVINPAIRRREMTGKAGSDKMPPCPTPAFVT